MGRQVLLALQTAVDTVDDVGRLRISNPGAQRGIPPIRAGTQGPGDTDQLEGPVAGPQPQHVEGGRVVSKPQIVVRSRPPVHLVLAEFHLDSGQGENHVSPAFVVVGQVSLELGNFQAALVHLVPPHVLPAPLLQGLGKADAVPDPFGNMAPHASAAAMPENLLAVRPLAAGEDIGLLLEKQLGEELSLGALVVIERSPASQPPRDPSLLGERSEFLQLSSEFLLQEQQLFPLYPGHLGALVHPGGNKGQGPGYLQPAQGLDPIPQATQKAPGFEALDKAIAPVLQGDIHRDIRPALRHRPSQHQQGRAPS